MGGADHRPVRLLRGDIYYLVALEGLDAPPYPSWADAGYLSIFPAAYVALVLLLRARAGRVSSVLWLDGLVCALAIAAVGAALVFGVVASTEGSLATVATNLAYPLGDLLLLAFVIGVIVDDRLAGRAARGCCSRRPSRSWRSPTSIYLYETALGTYEEYTLARLAWPGASCSSRFAAWQPARRLDARSACAAGMLVAARGVHAAGAGLLVVDHYTRLNEMAIWLACGASLAAVIAVRADLPREPAHAARQRERGDDGRATGLGNRRALLRDLDARAPTPRPGAPRPAGARSTSTASSPTTTRSATRPATRCWRASGATSTAALGRRGSAYRMGGDEFCVLAARAARPDAARSRRATAALSEHGERFDDRLLATASC